MNVPENICRNSARGPLAPNFGGTGGKGLGTGGVLGVGTDLADIAPFRRRTFGTHPGFYRLVFTGAECDYCLSRPDPAPHWAARFAAKEAAVKALGAAGVTVAVPQIEVTRTGKGVPSLRVTSRRGERVPGPPSRLLVSLSHGADFVVAYVVVTPPLGNTL